MEEIARARAAGEEAASAVAIRKAFAILMPWCIVFYILAYLDRINIGFAALTMNAALGLSATAFGLASTISYVMYVGCEVPSTLMLARYGARRWIPRIMIMWGIASMATALATGALSLYFIRALVGIAEAGLVPGILYYLGQWFPRAHRAKANAMFLASLPLAIVIGGPISGLIFQLDGFWGVSGWQWIFILEGLPPVIVGFMALRFLPDGPATARWLREEEASALMRQLQAEQAAVPVDTPVRWRDRILSKRDWALAGIYFCIQATTNTLGVWTPLIIKDAIGSASLMVTASLTAVPALCSIVCMLVVSARSDKTQAHGTYLIAAMLSCAAGWLLVASSQAIMLRMLGLTICFCGLYTALSTFWARAAALTPRREQAFSVGFVSSIGTSASIVSPYIIGVLRDWTHSFNTAALYVAGLLILGTIGLVRMGHK